MGSGQGGTAHELAHDPSGRIMDPQGHRRTGRSCDRVDDPGVGRERVRDRLGERRPVLRDLHCGRHCAADVPGADLAAAGVVGSGTRRVGAQGEVPGRRVTEERIGVQVSPDRELVGDTPQPVSDRVAEEVGAGEDRDVRRPLRIASDRCASGVKGGDAVFRRPSRSVRRYPCRCPGTRSSRSPHFPRARARCRWSCR